jgi:hypothetical protein
MVDNVQLATETGNACCWEISGSHGSVTKNANLLGCYAAPLGKQFYLL